jgi:site-specific DNA-adenine methylase
LTGTDLSKVEFTQKDYRDYVWQEGDVVYADPPYKGTYMYYRCGKFDHDGFWEWVRTRDYPVYVSEYSEPDDFTSIWSKVRHGLVQPHGFSRGTARLEQLFLHERFVKSHN